MTTSSAAAVAVVSKRARTTAALVVGAAVSAAAAALITASLSDERCGDRSQVSVVFDYRTSVASRRAASRRSLHCFSRTSYLKVVAPTGWVHQRSGRAFCAVVAVDVPFLSVVIDVDVRRSVRPSIHPSNYPYVCPVCRTWSSRPR